MLLLILSRRQNSLDLDFLKRAQVSTGGGSVLLDKIRSHTKAVTDIVCIVNWKKRKKKREKGGFEIEEL